MTWRNCETCETDVTLSTDALNTLCTACFISSNMDIAKARRAGRCGGGLLLPPQVILHRLFCRSIVGLDHVDVGKKEGGRRYDALCVLAET